MQTWKCEFIEFMVRAGVLRFGAFTTKSGRETPYFIDTGRYATGAQIARLGGYYARAIQAGFPDGVDVLFGPAYKGIPLVTAAAAALAREYDRDLGFAFNRKEAKDHGEKGALVGRPLQDGDRVVIVEDVITAGTSVRETVPLLQAAARVRVMGLVVAVDRMERGEADQSALDELRARYGLKTVALVTLAEIVDYLHNRPVDGRVVLDDAVRERIRAYRAAYGAGGG